LGSVAVFCSIFCGVVDEMGNDVGGGKKNAGEGDPAGKTRGAPVNVTGTKEVEGVGEGTMEGTI
jgi:hypothetical protein